MKSEQFDAIIGADSQKKILRSALARPAHGYLFTGADGLGSHLLAESFIRALLEFDHDRELISNPDFVLLEREENKSGSLKKELSVELVRTLRQRMSRSPVGTRLVAYIPEADALNMEGVNALLKAIEEPRASSVFILVSHAEYALPATLRSRLVRIPLTRVPSSVLHALLQKHTSDPNQIDRILRLSDGRPGLAMRMLDEPGLSEQYESAIDHVRAILGAQSPGEAFAAIRDEAESADKSDDPVASWRETLQLWEWGVRMCWIEQPERAAHFGIILTRARRAIGGPVSPRIWIELGLVRMTLQKPTPFPSFLPSSFPYPNDI